MIINYSDYEKLVENHIAIDLACLKEAASLGIPTVYSVQHYISWPENHIPVLIRRRLGKSRRRKCVPTRSYLPYFLLRQHAHYTVRIISLYS